MKNIIRDLVEAVVLVAFIVGPALAVSIYQQGY